jgi:nucleotide-binding universal stress UspA family protein
MTATTLKADTTLGETKPSLLRFRKILAPIDFSPASKAGMKHALRFAGECGAQVTLLYVFEITPPVNFAGMPGAAAFFDSDLSTAQKNLRSLVASTRNENIQRLKWRVRVGVPSHEIVEEARECDVDLIVIATHGYTGWKHFCIGSTAERVVRAAPCPVLVVREKEHGLS